MAANKSSHQASNEHTMYASSAMLCSIPAALQVFTLICYINSRFYVIHILTSCTLASDVRFKLL